MSSTEAGAPLLTDNTTGNVNDQCFGGLNLDTNCLSEFEHSKGVGQPLLDQLGQVGSVCGNTNGQNAIDSSMATDGSNIGKLGTDGDKATGNVGQPLLDSGGHHDSGKGNAIGQNGNGSSKATDGRNFDSKFKGKQSFASLFKDNRAPSEQSKLHFVAPPLLGDLEIASEDIDSVEKSFGFCLVGYVMGPRPSPFTVKNFIKGWGESVKFTFKDI